MVFLSQCYTSNLESTVWVMKEYGIKRSWHKEVVINVHLAQPDCRIPEYVYLLERSKDGTIFFFLPYFSEVAYRPSFFKLQTFESDITGSIYCQKLY